MLEKFGINLPFLLTQILHFLILIWVLNKLLFGRIGSMLDERRNRIAEAMAEAERVGQEAASERARLEAQIAEERREAQANLRQAVARSEEAAERRKSEAEEEARTILAKARSDAEQSRQQALSGLQAEIASLALAAAAKVLGEGVDEKQHRSLIDRFLKEELGDLA
ncbi:MAG: F0F1 ATP synthase subunit B [Chloroflexi bacterium]|nr:F0F1 ATP synthase subunit B [Chloroflexota bacterium]